MKHYVVFTCLICSYFVALEIHKCRRRCIICKRDIWWGENL